MSSTFLRLVRVRLSLTLRRVSLDSGSDQVLKLSYCDFREYVGHSIRTIDKTLSSYQYRRNRVVIDDAVSLNELDDYLP